MKDLPVNRVLLDNMRLEDVIVNGVLYAAYVTRSGEVCFTDLLDKTKIYALMSMEFYQWITGGENDV